MRFKAGRLSDAKINKPDRYIGVYIDSKSIESPNDEITDIIERFPDQDIYQNNKNRKPGTVVIDAPLIYIIGQIIPRTDSYETADDRIETFKKCMNHLVLSFSSLNPKSEIKIALDKGCGYQLHGNKWKIYKHILQEIEDNSNIEFLIYKE